MHYLHKILVKVAPELDREEKIKEARSTAVSETECFYEYVWDWRETESAGRWAYEYPLNVILAEDNVDKFLDHLQRCKQMQLDTVSDDMKSIGEGDLFKMIQESKFEEIYNRGLFTPFGLDLWKFHRIINLLSGEYIPDSYFFNVDDRDSRITDELIEKIKKSPKEYALVIFDQHI